MVFHQWLYVTVILGLVLVGLSSYWCVVRPRIKLQRVRQARDAFGRQVPSITLADGQERFAVDVAKLRAANTSMAKAIRKIHDLAPNIPDPEKGEEVSELRARMKSAIDQDLKGISVGTIELGISELLKEAGYPIPELVADAIDGIRNHIAEHPEDFVDTLKPLLALAAEPSADHAVQAMELFSFAFPAEDFGHHLHGAEGVAVEATDLGTADIGSESLGNAADSFDVGILAGIPIFTLGRSLWRECGRAMEGKVSAGRAAEHVATDVAGTGLGGFLGTALIPIPIVGTAVGAFVGRMLSNLFKGRRYRKAVTEYEQEYKAILSTESVSVRRMYRSNREKSVEVRTLFGESCGDVILPADTAEILSLVSILRINLTAEKEEVGRRLDIIQKSVLSETKETWIDRVLGFSSIADIEKSLQTDSECALSKLLAGYPETRLDDSLHFLECIAATPSLRDGPLAHCLVDSSALISQGIASQLKAFVEWSTKAMALRAAAVAAIVENLAKESKRHSHLMDPLHAQLGSLSDKVRTEAEALGAKKG
jgi:hypothetical protein